MISTRCERLLQSKITRQMQTAQLQQVIHQELTELQRYTVVEYYFHRQTIEQIARKRSVNKSTVCRTLHRAEDKLKRFLNY